MVVVYKDFVKYDRQTDLSKSIKNARARAKRKEIKAMRAGAANNETSKG